MAAKTGDKQKEKQQKHIGTCSHEVKPIMVWRTMKWWCEKCADYKERVKK
jgi:hypothetical protein